MAIEDLQDALAHLFSNAGQKLLDQDLMAGILQVFIQANRFRKEHMSMHILIKVAAQLRQRWGFNFDRM